MLEALIATLPITRSSFRRRPRTRLARKIAIAAAQSGLAAAKSMRIESRRARRCPPRRRSVKADRRRMPSDDVTWHELRLRAQTTAEWRAGLAVKPAPQTTDLLLTSPRYRPSEFLGPTHGSTLWL